MASSPAVTSSRRHSLAEDAHAIMVSAMVLAVGLTVLREAGLATGGIAGIALIVSYLTHWPVGVVFFVVNLPFYVLAQRALGWRFTIKTLITNALLAVLTLFIPSWMAFTNLDPVFAAIFGGTICGMGILFLARHGASVGGLGVLAIYLQEKHGRSLGRFQIASDVLIITASLLVVDVRQFALSILSAIALSLVLIINHRPGRYTGY